MKKLMFLFLALAFAASTIQMTSGVAFAEKYESVTITATAVGSDWTLLQGSALKHSAFRIYGRSGQLDLLVLSGGSNTNNASAYYVTVPAGSQYANEVYKGTQGTYVKVSGTGLSETVEFESKRPASYWPWR